MKKLISTAILLAMFATFGTIKAQTQKEEYLGLPGDNLNLYAVMKLFQESETLEGFEKNLNDENSKINNLDLNEDNYVDYIKVIDYVDDEVHNIVLQVAVNARENQDVAVFTVQRFANGQVQIQLIGDENLYGKNYIIEPIYDENIAGHTPNPGYKGNAGNNVTVVRTTSYEIASWPVIRYIYLPSYRVWHSSWYWNYYPSYWHPWKPYYWHYYYGYHYNSYNDYYRYYHRYDRPRYSRWNDFYYTGYRSHSNYVTVNINKGSYKTTYSRPDERRRGEAQYESSHVSQNNRRSTNQVSPSRQSTGNSTNVSRRTTTTTRNQGSGNTSGQNNSSARRTTTTIQNRSTEQPSSRQTNSGERRTTTTQTKSSSQPSSGQNSGTARRTSTTVNKSAPTSSSRQGNNNARSTTTTVRQQSSKPSSSGSSAKSRSASKPSSSNTKATTRQNSRPSSSSKSSENKKAAEPTSSSRRK